MPIRIPLNRSLQHDEKSDYGNFSKSKIITLFQVPHYEYLQILICKENSLTTLAGVEHIKHLWKLDVSNNQIRSLQHLSRFIALGSLNLANNQLQWIELQHIRHMMILDLRLDGNRILDTDPHYRQHVIDCLPRLWMCDGIFISTAERNQVEEFFTHSSLATKPVRHKLARDFFMPTNLKDRSINGLFGSKAMDLFAKFPVNCFVNAEMDKKRIKHLASTMQDLILTEIRNEETGRDDEFLMDNRHILYHMMDIRSNHVEEFNMFLILLMTDLSFTIPRDLLTNLLDVTHLNTIENLKLQLVFSSSKEIKCSIASLLHAATRLDRDENHPSAYYDKLFHSLSIVLTNEIRQLCLSNPYPNASSLSEAKTMVCLEMMQVFIMCPMFYTMIKDSNVSTILQQALDQSPAYGSIRNVLESLNSEEKSADEQRDLLAPILGNIIKMTIRTFSTKRMKKSTDNGNRGENDPSTKRDSEVNANASPRPKMHRVPTIGDRVLIAPQTFGRIVTMPDGDIAMIQLDNILAINGSMITNGSLNDHTNYVGMNNFEWDTTHEYWKPKNTHGDRITLQISSAKTEPVRNVPPPAFHPSRTLTTKVPDGLVRPRGPAKAIEINLKKPKEAFTEPPRPPTPPLISVSAEQEEPVPPETTVVTSQEMPTDHPMAVRIAKQTPDEATSTSPVLIESMLLLMPDQNSSNLTNPSQSRGVAGFSTMATMNDFDHASSTYRRSISKNTSRVHVPVKNASTWFNGPDVQNERSERMEKVLSGLVRRSARSNHQLNMPRVPVLTSPSSRDHALYKGTRPGTIPDFCLESQRIGPAPIQTVRVSQSSKDRTTPFSRSYDLNRTYHSSPNVYAMKSLANQPCPTPSWL